MIKRMGLILTILVSFNLFSQQKYHTYQEELVTTFNFGDKEDEFSYVSGEPEALAGPNAMTFDNDGNLVIVDTWDNRIVLLNSKYELNKIINIEENSYFKYSKIIISKEDGIVASRYNDVLGKIDFEGQFIIKAYYHNSPLYQIIDEGNYIEHNNYIFQYMEDGSLIAFYPDKKTDETKQLNHDEIVSSINSGDTEELKGLTIDGKNRIFLNGKLLTRDYYTYLDYFQDKMGAKDFQVYRKDLRHKYWPEHKENLVDYIGQDSNKNTYWISDREMISVFNKDGSVIVILLINRNKSKTIPAVHPNGDVYFLDYDDKEVRLYKIKNVWD